MKRLISYSAVGLLVGALVAALWFSKGEPPPQQPLTPVEPPTPIAPGDAFPWSGVTTLTDDAGATLSWTVERDAGEVLITAVHRGKRVEHRARPDGTPLSTVRIAGGYTTRVTWSAAGTRVERTDARGKTSSVTLEEPDLWDGETLAARLAGLAWGPGKRVRLKLVDLDLADGTVYPMVAEYLGEERCGALPCHHVRLALEDFRRVFAPTFEYRYGTAGAPCLRYDGGGSTYRAR